LDERPRVLIVDDDDTACEVIRSYLWQEPYTIITLSNGREALERVEEIAPDIILLDVMMPEMDGFEVCRCLRADPQVAEVPIVLVTALEDRDSRVEGVRAGADDFLTKPIDAALLRARVHTITRLNRYRRHLEERQKFVWLVEQLQDGVLILDADGYLRYVNEQARRYFNLPAEGLPEITFLTLAQQYFQPHPLDAWEHWPAPEAADFTQPRYLVRPDTAAVPPLWLKVTTFPLRQDRTGSWVVHLRDVTQEIGTHQEIYEFHAMVSHKLRTPLTHVVGGLELLTLLGDTADAEKRHEYVELARDGARRLQLMLSDIFEYRDRAHAFHTPGGFDLSQLPEVLKEVQTRFEIAPIQLLETEVAGQVTLSREDITLMLLELCENAQKFHPTHTPTITLSLAAVGEAAVCLRMCDDGRHLPQEQLTTIWLPYYQSDRYMTGEVPGIGLGLPLVATLLWNAGGACRAYNRPDRPGLVIELKLPRRLPSTSPAADAEGEGMTPFSTLPL